MRLFTRILGNSLWLFGARVGAQVCAVIVTSLLARRLSVEGFGEYSFIAAAILIGNVLTTFGSDMYLIREIAAGNERSRIFPALTLQIILSCLFIGVVAWIAPYLPNQTPESIAALQVYNLALIPLAFFTVFTSALRGAQKMRGYAWLNLAFAVLQVAVISLFFQRGEGVVTLAYLLLGIQTAGAVLGGILCASNFPDFWKGWHVSMDRVRELFVACLPIALIAILGIVYQKSSLTMLTLIGSASMTAWFSAAARVIEAARLGHVAALTALYPAMANARENKSSPGVFNFSWALLFVIAGGTVVLLFFLAEPIVGIFFGLAYQPSVPLLRILSFTLLPYTVNSYLSLVFLVEHRERALMRVLFVSLMTLLLLNAGLIPRAGSLGASWSFLAAETLQACLLLFEWKINRLRASQAVRASRGVANELSHPS